MVLHGKRVRVVPETDGLDDPVLRVGGRKDGRRAGPDGLMMVAVDGNGIRLSEQVFEQRSGHRPDRMDRSARVGDRSGHLRRDVQMPRQGRAVRSQAVT